MKNTMTLLGLGFVVVFCTQAVADHTRVSSDTALLDGYHLVQTALAKAKDDFSEAKTSATDLVKISQDWITNSTPQHPQLDNVKKALAGSEGVSQAKEAKEYRGQFAVLSEGVVEFIKKDGTLKADWTLYYCPMAPTYKYWAQPKTETKKMNPYMGAGSMQQCGSAKPWPAIVSRLDDEEQ